MVVHVSPEIGEGEALADDDLAADIDHADERAASGYVGHRPRGVGDVVAAHPGAGESSDDGGQLAVGDDHALGRAGRPRCVDYTRRVVGAGCRLARGWALVCINARFPSDFDNGQIGAGQADLGRALRANQNQLRLRIGQDVAKETAPEVRVDRHLEGAGASTGDPDGVRLDRPREHRCHPSAVPHSQAAEPAQAASHFEVERSVSE